ncbi:MAG: FMN-binding protein [Spirochaetales bacterium]|uniref:Ion-translocating oxidoreductase complex subunit G n=1 Tax=Candidatus Thalassospirochaeta sargassi TaxID=3119039 RepID=A0AAJ1IGE5_9SPIO|nr:FMN-binding protein [Spirochaetales bacterium]
MTDMLKTGSKLALICAVAALCLGAVNMVTEPQIAKFRAAKLQEALGQVSPGGAIGEEVAADDAVVISYYPVEDSGAISGYILNLKGAGYGGDLIILASFKPDGELIGSVLMEHDETPGLGKEAENDWYMKKYLGFKGGNIPTSKTQLSQADADAISGATITYTGIGNALIAGSDFAVELGGK